MVYGLKWSPCPHVGGQLAAALGDGAVAVYGVERGKGRGAGSTLRLDARLGGGHTMAATTVDWCPADWAFASRRSDGECEGECEGEVDGISEGKPRDDPEGRSRYLVSGGNDGNIVLWDVLERRVVDGIRHGEGPNAVKCGGGGEGRVYVADTSNSIRLYHYR